MKIMKVLSTLLVVAMILAMGATSVFALTTPNGLTPNHNSKVEGEMNRIGGNIMGTIQIVAIVLAVVILMILGIKYMMGSAEEKAEYKKTMIPYLVGAVFIFAAGTLANLAYQVASGFNA